MRQRLGALLEGCESVTHLPERISSGCSFTSIAFNLVCSSRVWINKNSVVDIAIRAISSLVLETKYKKLNVQGSSLGPEFVHYLVTPVFSTLSVQILVPGSSVLYLLSQSVSRQSVRQPASQSVVGELFQHRQWATNDPISRISQLLNATRKLSYFPLLIYIHTEKL
jgi:hypothetical protein